MISRGDAAPTFELPAVVDGEYARVALADYLGEDIVILAFYPGDFNPACGNGTGLDDLDLFTMQKDVTILGISGGSVHSHRAFAAEYDLHIPLLADVRGEVAAEYGVRADGDAGYLTDRAVVVIAPTGEVEYAWRTDDPARLPDVSAVRRAVEQLGSDDTARARYRVGHAHYTEGRRAFTSAMQDFQGHDWLLARGDFAAAHEEFADAMEQFNSAVRLGENDTEVAAYERAEDKAEALWQASEWLAEAASAYASGEGAQGETLRRDAETHLEEARAIDDPPDPDAFPLEADSRDDHADPGTGATLDVDIDARTSADPDSGQRDASDGGTDGAGETGTGANGNSNDRVVPDAPEDAQFDLTDPTEDSESDDGDERGTDSGNGTENGSGGS